MQNAIGPLLSFLRNVLYVDWWRHTHTHTTILWLCGICPGQPGWAGTRRNSLWWRELSGNSYPQVFTLVQLRKFLINDIIRGIYCWLTNGRYITFLYRQAKLPFVYPTSNQVNTHTTVLLLFWNMSGTTRVSRYQKSKTNLDLLEQEIVSGSGICWAICKSAPHPRQPRQHPTSQFFTDGCPSWRPTNSVKALKASACYNLVTSIALVIGK